MIGFESLDEKQKKKISEIIGKCENCGVVCSPTPHRINRGYAGGKYVLRNLYWLCRECHKVVHCNEGRKKGM